MTVYQILQLITSFFVPIIIVVGFYVSLRIDITRNQERIENLKADISEIKVNVKEIKNKLIK